MKIGGWGVKTWLFYGAGWGKKITSIKSHQLLPKEGICEAEKCEKSQIFGGIQPQENHFLMALAKGMNPKKIFEFGTCTGTTTSHLALNTEALIYTIDLPPQISETEFKTEKTEQAYMHQTTAAAQLWKRKGIEPRIVPLFGDTARYDFSPYAHQCELVFVDASHAYSYVKNDSKKAFDVLAERGAVVWHDYVPCWPGVVKALNELAKERKLMHVQGTSLVVYYSDLLRREWGIGLK